MLSVRTIDPFREKFSKRFDRLTIHFEFNFDLGDPNLLNRQNRAGPPVRLVSPETFVESALKFLPPEQGSSSAMSLKLRSIKFTAQTMLYLH